jgi:hypothetical protein
MPDPSEPDPSEPVSSEPVSSEPDPSEPVSPGRERRVQPATVRRAPRYRAFIGTGVVLGAVLGVVATMVFPDDGHFSTGAVAGYLSVTLGLLGGLLGGVAAVVAERRQPRG